MHPDRDFDPKPELPANAAVLTQDLEVNTLLAAMARGDQFLFDVAGAALSSSLRDPGSIAYRQDVLADCLAHSATVRAMYGIAVEGVDAEKKVRLGWLRDTPESLLRGSVQVLEILMDVLRRLRQLAEAHAGEFHSEGLVQLCAMLAAELEDGYLEAVGRHLEGLKFRGGILMSARLGKGGRGADHVVRTPRGRGFIERITTAASRGGYTFRIADRDESGFRALGELRGRGLHPVATALAQSTDHILGFFAALRAELAFYIGCLNLHEQLAAKGGPTCFPAPGAPGTPDLEARDLYDVCLTLHLEGRAVGNDVAAEGRALVMITGANQGGKSTFLRSVGLAQLMMESGMFVAAESFRANISDGLFTHYRREEDAGMESGKLDEELGRMSAIADAIAPNCVLLCNESFAATNEREGAEIARQVVRALVERGVRVLFVTHLYDLSHGFCVDPPAPALFLRAPRAGGGERAFKLVEGEPLPTSYGEDSYRRVFGTELGGPAAVAGRPRRGHDPGPE
jgi:MutS domain V